MNSSRCLSIVLLFCTISGAGPFACFPKGCDNKKNQETAKLDQGKALAGVALLHPSPYGESERRKTGPEHLVAVMVTK